MIGIKFKSVAILLMLIEFVIASNSDGFCTVLETHTVEESRVEAYYKTIQVTYACNIFFTCSKYKIIRATRAVPPVVGTRTKVVCCKGYTSKDNKCLPICKFECENGQCTAPDTCTCDSGFIHSPSSFSRCICKDGYKYNLQSKQCDPICSNPCTNGVCSAPEDCKCSPGYHKNMDDICIKNECDPSSTDVSNDQCRNGTCTSIGVCQCNEGFAKNDSSRLCEPLCDACINGICIAPNQCACLAGFERNAIDSKCLPHCHGECLNGKCVAPDKCVCDPGYEALNSSACNPICKEACIFGTCIEPGKCSCFAGYQLQNGSNHICDPVCTGGCLNGKCEKPDWCACDQGYEFIGQSKVCEPVCDEQCVNSNCTSPNVCTCEMGFTPMNSTHCNILCENCTYGYCEEPNVCLCDVGYHMDIEGEMCVQDECTSNGMEVSCENGYCSDGVCVCDFGYEKNASMVCAPVCSPKCINGYCSGPDVCQCYNGYELNATNGNDCIDSSANIYPLQENVDDRVPSWDSMHSWNIVVGAIVVSAICVLSVIVISYICKTDVDDCKFDEGHLELSQCA